MDDAPHPPSTLAAAFNGLTTSCNPAGVDPVTKSHRVHPSGARGSIDCWHIPHQHRYRTSLQQPAGDRGWRNQGELHLLTCLRGWQILLLCCKSYVNITYALLPLSCLLPAALCNPKIPSKMFSSPFVRLAIVSSCRRLATAWCPAQWCQPSFSECQAHSMLSRSKVRRGGRAAMFGNIRKGTCCVC